MEELGIPYGAKLYQNGNVIVELGNLHHIHVVLDASLGDAKQFKRLDTKISRALEENNVVSGSTLASRREWLPLRITWQIRISLLVLSKSTFVEVHWEKGLLSMWWTPVLPFMNDT